MTSNFACLGLGELDQDSFGRLLDQIMPAAQLLGELGDGVTVHRWEDPSRVRVTVTLQRDQIVDLLPSLGGAVGARLGNVHRAGAEVLAADVLDEGGETVTRMAAASERVRFLGEDDRLAGEAVIVALGSDVSVHPDEDAFNASDASRVDGGDMRMASESFVPFGMFGAEPGPYAEMFGVVLHAERRTLTVTGGEFSVVRVRTVGFEADLCLPGDVPTPVPGNVVGGTVYLIADLPGFPG